jgi:hypothetical protein
MVPSSCVSGTTVFACVAARRLRDKGEDAGEAFSRMVDRRARGAGSCFCAVRGWSLGLMWISAVDVLGRLDDLAVEAVGRCEVVLFLAVEGCGPLRRRRRWGEHDEERSTAGG